jgi:hypothetical protein
MIIKHMETDTICRDFNPQHSKTKIIRKLLELFRTSITAGVHITGNI